MAEKEIYEKFVDNGWNVERRKDFFLYSRTVTLDGATQNFDIHPSFLFLAYKVSMNFSDTTAKDYSVQMFRDPTASEYEDIRSATGNSAQRVIIGIGDYYPPGARIRVQFSGSTAGKTVVVVATLSKV